MTTLSVYIASSIDGYIATEDGSLEWLEAAARSDEDYGYTAFLAEGLIDDLVLTTAPVLLGRGRPLFLPIAASATLELVGVRSWPSGFVNRTYRRG